FLQWRFKLQMIPNEEEIWDEHRLGDGLDGNLCNVIRRKDRKARTLISLALDNAFIPLIAGTTTTKEMYDALSAHFERQAINSNRDFCKCLRQKVIPLK